MRPFARLAFAAALGAASAPAVHAQTPPPPTILFDVAPRAVEYQLSRLSNEELSRVERSTADPKYRPVYAAILTRAGMPRADFDEALAALAKMDGTSPARVLLGALGRVPADDEATAARLVKALLSQDAAMLRQERPAFAAAAGAADASPVTLRGAYGGLMLADGSADRAWQAAASRPEHLLRLLESVPAMPAGGTAAASLTPRLATLAAQPPDARTRAAALAALAAVRPDAATFRLLADALPQLTGDDDRLTVLRALQAVPPAAWPQAEVEPLARAVVALVRGLPPEQRTTEIGLDAVQVGTALAAAVTTPSGRELRRALRDLGVQVVRINTVPEEMRFDVKWFAVEAGKPVQIVLTNPDTMSHNLVVGQPKSVREIGTMAATMPMPSDPSIKPYVPDSPLVIKATRLLNWGETARLDLVAPKDPGEYVFLCTFPGHWVRMYGVMLVVPDLESWEATRTPPTDPVTGQPYASAR